MLRFEYDAVVAFHPYRTYQPWDHGGTKILHVDGVNIMSEVERRDVADRLRQVESELIRRAREAGIDAREDNHYGFTVRADGAFNPSGPPRELYFQLRFSDGSLYVWLMPGAPDAGP